MVAGARKGSSSLKVAVLTRTGRTSGQHLAEAVTRTRHSLCGVLAERRSAMWRSALRRRGLVHAIRHYGLSTLLSRLKAALTGRRNRGGVCLPTTVIPALNSNRTVAILTQWEPDVILIANAPVLVPQVLTAAQVCAINFHSGRLPDYGGVASEYWALHDGARQAWATLHIATGRLDSGAILAETAIDIHSDDTAEMLHTRLVQAAVGMLPALLDAVAAYGPQPIRDPGPATLRPWPKHRPQPLERRIRGKESKR